MVKLYCHREDAVAVCRLIAGLHRRYTWIELDEFFVLALETTPRALETYDPLHRTAEGRSTKFSSWLVTLVRNDLLMFIEKEVRVRKRYHGGFAFPSTLASSSNASEALICQDELQHLSRLLSPLAEAILRVRLRCQPVRLTSTILSKLLSISREDVAMLSREIRETVKYLMEVDE